MPARILAIPLFIIFAVLLYVNMQNGGQSAWYLVPAILLLAAVYILSPQINWWWYSRNPPEVAAPIRELFARYSFYQRLPTSEQLKFRQRVALFVMANDFIPQIIEKVPEDVKYIVAANAVTLTFGQKNFLFPKFENIIINPKPLPTLQYPDNYHASEIYEPDGAVLFSMPQLVQGFVESTRYFNIGLYEYAKIFFISHAEIPPPELSNDVWESLEKVSGFSKSWIEQWINLSDIDPLAVSVAHFFTLPEAFRKELPELFEQFRMIFKMQSG